MMYNVIILQDLRFRPSKRKRSVSVFKKNHSGDRYQNLLFWCPKASFSSERRKKILVFKTRAVQSRLLNIGLVLFIINIILFLLLRIRPS